MGCTPSCTNCPKGDVVVGTPISKEPIRVVGTPICKEPARAVSPMPLQFHEGYLLMGKLGKGAFATVYLARQTGACNEVAVKVLDLRPKDTPSFTGAPDARRWQAARTEVEMMQAVRGKAGLVQMVGHFFDGSLAYIIMERCDTSLLNALEHLPAYTESALKPFFQGMLKSIAALHSAGIVHRDVKPDNFMCVGRGVSVSVKLGDFGLAAAMPSDAPGLTGIYGTPPFMSPEMLKGQPYGQKIDTWALGVTLYILLFGQLPYEGTEHTGKAVKVAIFAGNPLPSFKPKGGNVRFSKEVTSLVRELLTREPHLRPTADQALEHAFWRSPANHYEESLRMMLYAAKRTGAFDVGHKKPVPNEVEVHVMAQQYKHHGQVQPKGEVRAAPPPPKTRPPSLSEVAQSSPESCKRGLRAPSDTSTMSGNSNVLSEGDGTEDNEDLN